MEKAVKFLKNMDGNVGIIHDTDGDGVCSAALIVAYLKSHNIKFEIFPAEYEKSVFDNIATKNLENYIILDFGLSQSYDLLENFKKKNVLIIDHHVIERDLNKDGFVFVNPRLKNPNSYISTTSLSYKICKKAGLKDLNWLKRIGDVADAVINGSKKEREASDIIFAVKAMKGKEALIDVVNFLSETKGLEEFIYNKNYRDNLIEFRKELEKEIDRFEKEGEKDIAFFKLATKRNITPSVANYLFTKYPKKTIFVLRKDDGYYNISGRSHEYNLANILNVATKGIGRGGGHPVAAGGKIKAKYLKVFEKRVKELILSQNK